MDAELPLSGIRILSLEQFGAGPFSTMHLADLGAEIIKIENPGDCGDVSRYLPPYQMKRDSIYFQVLNRNKKSVALDISTPAGREIFEDLVRLSDAVYNNLRGGVPRKLRVDYAGLKSINPKIVCCSLSGFGQTGPRSEEPGYDYLMQAYAGLMSLTGDPGAAPTKAGVSIVDFTSSFISSLGLVIALLQSHRTGRGCDVDVALLDSAISMLNYLAAFYLNKDDVPQRLPNSAHPTLYPSQTFRTKDAYLVVMCAKEKFWLNLCEIIGLPHLALDPRFLTFGDRLENNEELIPLLQDRLLARTTAEWLESMVGHVPCAPVNSVPDALQDMQVVARDMIVDVSTTNWGVLQQIGNPLKFGTPIKLQEAPRFGQHSEEILRDILGYSHDRIDELSTSGTVELGG